METEIIHDQYRTLGQPLDDDDAGRRLDGYLAENFLFLTRSGWQKRIDGGQVLIGWRRVRPSYRLKPGDIVHFYHPREAEPEVSDDVYPIWRHGAVMAVYKPPNLPMHENGPYRHHTFAKLVADKIGPEWAAVHRLDRETSGIVLCGATTPVRNKLSQYLMHRVVEKEYLAIARGVAKAPKFRECGPIGDLKESQIRIKKWVVDGGLPSETWFDVEEQKIGHVLLRAFPKTGRTNQIRIHSAYNGMPLVGDKLYHPDESVFLNVYENGVSEETIAKTGFKRLCLHAASITFLHPETGRDVTVRCELPEDMAELWRSLAPSSH